jgi:hypothetical protein
MKDISSNNATKLFKKHDNTVLKYFLLLKFTQLLTHYLERHLQDLFSEDDASRLPFVCS